MSLRIVGGTFKGRTLKTPKTNNTRPTTSMLREALFNICAPMIDGARFLDLFAGSGAMGLEAISRGAQFSTFVEQSFKAVQCIQENVHLLGIEPQVQILRANALEVLSKLLGPYDIIYIDPPYGLEAKGVLQKIFDQKLLTPDGTLFLEQRYDPKADFSRTPLQLVESRRYGIAHLHQFRYRAEKSLQDTT